MCEDCDHDGLLALCDELLRDWRYGFAADTLRGIAVWVGEYGHATHAQWTAVRNIQQGGDKPRQKSLF